MRFMPHNLGKMLLTAVLALGVTSCGTKSVPTTLGDEMLANYVQPETYKDHRAQQNFFETSSGRIAFTDHGGGQNPDAETLVLLHGVPTSSWMYRKLIPQITLDMRVITVDLLGYGSSDKPKNVGDIYSPKTQAQRVEALLSERGVTHYNILMHDMGGLVAWEMLRNHPDKVDGLVVLNTIIDQDGFNHPDMNAGFMTRQLMKAYSSKLTSAAILDKTFGDLGLKGDYKLTEDECYGYVRPMREGADDALYSFFTGLDDAQFSRLDNHQTLWPDYAKTYTTDVLVMWGDKDEILTSKQIESLKAGFNLPDENIHIFENNAHFLAEEIPEILAEKITVFVNN